MTPKHIYLLLLALLAINKVAAQNEDELQIPEENDNQFPPDKHSDVIEGSGYGVVEQPEDIEITTAGPPPIENIQPFALDDNVDAVSSEDDFCPKPCVCRIEGSSNDFVVDCSGYDLTELPLPINERTTILNIQKNKIIKIPKEISSLKNLKVLNADDNSIANIASGSVSELPALVTLKLRNNRLIEYPTDLKNAFGLIKLEELDLGGNDMRSALSSEIFEKFKSLRTVVLPSSTPELPQQLCDILPKSLENICIKSCENKLFECQVNLKSIDGDLPVLPGMMSFENDYPDLKEDTATELNIEKQEPPNDVTPPKENSMNASNIVEFSFRSAVNKHPSDFEMHNTIEEAPKDVLSSSETPVKVGATTSDTKSGGVDKSIIGLVVAGMIVVVAGITIKKNWSSIKKRFSSNNRTPNSERTGGNTNGTKPDEAIPLQEKSPV